MNYLTQDDLDKINKWYYSPYFSLFLAFFWILYGIPLLIAIILQFTRQKKIKQLTQQYQPLIGHEDTILNIIDYNQRLKKLEEEYKEKESKMNTILTANVKNLKIDVEKLKQEKQDIIKELDALKTEAITKHFDFSDFDHITSGEYKNKLAVSRLNEEQDLKNNKLISISTSINDKKFISNNTKQIVRLFNSECDSIMTKVSVKNIDSSRNKITRSFNSLNKLFETDGIKLKQKWLEIKLDQLNILYL